MCPSSCGRSTRRGSSTGRSTTAGSTESEARFRLMFAGNPLPMWLYDMQTLAFLEVNDAAITLDRRAVLD